jgi:hypothetical protein
MAESTGKASGFISFIHTLRDQVPAETYAKILESVRPETAAIMKKPPIPIAWIDNQHFFDLVACTQRVAFAGRPEPFYDIGRKQMQHDMKTIYKVFMLVASPQGVIAKAASIYGTYTKNGRMSARELDKSSAEVLVEDVEGATPAFWHYQRGCIMGVIEQTRAKDLVCELVGGGGNEGRAQFKVRWAG